MGDLTEGGDLIAFPVPEGAPSCGMSLRDWFAGQYHDAAYVIRRMPDISCFMGEEEPHISQDWTSLRLRAEARIRYQYADAMLAAREVRS